MTYAWQKILFLRHRKTIVDWNDWKNGNKKEAIENEIRKLDKPWIPEEERYT